MFIKESSKWIYRLWERDWDLLLFTVLFALCGSTRGSNTQVSLFLSPISVVEFYPKYKKQQLGSHQRNLPADSNIFLSFAFNRAFCASPFVVKGRKQKQGTRQKETSVTWIQSRALRRAKAWKNVFLTFFFSCLHYFSSYFFHHRSVAYIFVYFFPSFSSPRFRFPPFNPNVLQRPKREDKKKALCTRFYSKSKVTL